LFTIPDELYQEIKELASKKNMKLNHLVTDALAEKARKMREEAFIQQINEVFEDPDVAEEQSVIANLISDNMDLKELPW